MSNNPVVSIVVIFLNPGRFFPEALESIFAQTYGNWELLLVDDGSTDGSTEIALRYCKARPDKVIYLDHKNHQNRGMSASRNLGINSATGEFIAFLDADDVWVPHKLEEQVAILNSHLDVAMVYGPIQWWYSWSGRPEKSNRRDFIPELNVQTNWLFQPPELLTPLLRRASVTVTNGLLRREAIKSVGGYEDSFRGMYEDQVLCAKICLKAPVFISSRCWYKWRKHPNSACAVAVSAGKYDIARLDFLRWLEEYVSQQGIKDEEIRKALNEEMWKCRNRFHFKQFTDAHGLAEMKESVKSLVRRTLPRPLYSWVQERRHGEHYLPRVGEVKFGNLRRVTPISRNFGFDRGLPVDRYYIEGFLAGKANDVRGRVLEVADDTYARRFGGGRVTKADVLHISKDSPQATIVADLSRADNVPSDIFDCIILTQTLNFIYDLRAAVSTLRRILKPGGVLLATTPGISQTCQYNWGASCWALTSLSARRLFEDVFAPDEITIEPYGNVLTATAFLHGLATEELRKEELDYRDPDYEVIIAIRAVKGHVI